MRRWQSIAKATALEILSEPLSLLLLLAALVMSTLAPAFHYHQFGEASRMARDAGFSALFTCGICFMVLGTVRSFRREIETCTIQMALAHPVSRSGFFFAKTIGVALAGGVFSLIVFSNLLVIVNGAEIGGVLASRSGEIAKLWGPSLAIGLAIIICPMIMGALLNRFCHFRFVLTTFAFSVLLSLGGVFYRFDSSLASRMLPVGVVILLPMVLLTTVAAALSVRFKTNVVVSAVALLMALLVPVAGNYYLPDALARCGVLSWSYVGLAVLAILPAVVAFLVLGIRLVNGRDVG